MKLVDRRKHQNLHGLINEVDTEQTDRFPRQAFLINFTRLCLRQKARNFRLKNWQVFIAIHSGQFFFLSAGQMHERIKQLELVQNPRSFAFIRRLMKKKQSICRSHERMKHVKEKFSQKYSLHVTEQLYSLRTAKQTQDSNSQGH